MIKTPGEIRLALPSKGRLAEPALQLLANAGLQVYQPNLRQYKASMPNLPGVTVLFQRPGDIVVSVRDGSVDFGLTGLDVVAEDEGAADQQEQDGAVLVIHPSLGFGQCSLNVIVPESWEDVNHMADLHAVEQRLGRPLHIASKFPHLTTKFLKQHGLDHAKLIYSEGTLEIAPEIGYADLIVDLVSSGTTLRDNRLKRLADGLILASQAGLIANKELLKTDPGALGVARKLLEFIVAHLRGTENVHVFANIRGESAQAIAAKMFTKDLIGGLQGPTLSSVITRSHEQWFAANLIVRKDQLVQAIAELREVGGSGVVVTPVTYIFEEEPQEYRNMLAALEEK